MRMRRPVKKEADDAIRRQKHVNAEAAARALLNDEPNYAEVNNNSHIYGEENARSTSLRPEILELQSEIYALEHANPVNDKKLQNARAMLELMESQQFLERIEDEIPRLIHMYGSESAMVLDMYDTHEKAIDRVDAAVAHLEALRDSGGGRRKTRKTRKTRKHKRHI